MNEKKKVSVIVPIYRVEPYIKKCLYSIDKQNVDRMEVLLVNDATDDASMDICQKWVRKDDRYKVIELPWNIGVGLARNIGILKAEGTYTFFCDPDDYLTEGSLGKMLSIVEEEPVDILKARCIFEKDGVAYKKWEQKTEFDKINMFSCNLYNTLFLKKYQIMFPKWRIAQDQVFLLKANMMAGQIANTDIETFVYCQYSKRFNTCRYGTVAAIEQVRAEMEMLDMLMGYSGDEYNQSVCASIIKMVNEIDIRISFMDLIEIVEMKYVSESLKDKFHVFQKIKGKYIEVENVIDRLEEKINARQVLLKGTI